MCGDQAGFQNRYFQDKGNLEAWMTHLESMAAAGILGMCCDASNEIDSNSYVTLQTSSIHQTLSEALVYTMALSYKLIVTSRFVCHMRVYTKLHY
jgi:hypothetical protein